MAKHLVTVRACIIVRNLVRIFLDKSHDVTIADNLRTSNRENMTDFIDRVEFVETDIRNRNDVTPFGA